MLHSFQIRTQTLHAAQLRHGQLAGDHNGDKQTVGNGIDPGIQAVGGADAADAFLNAVGFRTGSGQLGGQRGDKLH